MRLASKNPVVVSFESAPGLFLMASECLEGLKTFKLPRIPEPWRKDPPRVYFIPLVKEETVQNGNSRTLIDRLKEVNQLIQTAFQEIGCDVAIGAPTRFERKLVL